MPLNYFWMQCLFPNETDTFTLLKWFVTTLIKLKQKLLCQSLCSKHLIPWLLKTNNCKGWRLCFPSSFSEIQPFTSGSTPVVQELPTPHGVGCSVVKLPLLQPEEVSAPGSALWGVPLLVKFWTALGKKPESRSRQLRTGIPQATAATFIRTCLSKLWSLSAHSHTGIKGCKAICSMC